MTAPQTSPQPCRVCGALRSSASFVVGENRVLRCEECTHVFVDAVYTSESIQQMYESYEAIGTDQYFSGIDREVLSNFDAYLTRCREYLSSGSPQPRLLDVGCGTGAFLERAQKAGFLCEGIEICKPLADIAVRNVGCPVHIGLLSGLDLTECSFDVITMYDLIEHLPEPASDLRKVHKWLKPGGILFVLTPNDDALLRRIARLVFHGKLPKDRPPDAGPLPQASPFLLQHQEPRPARGRMRLRRRERRNPQSGNLSPDSLRSRTTCGTADVRRWRPNAFDAWGSSLCGPARQVEEGSRDTRSSVYGAGVAAHLRRIVTTDSAGRKPRAGRQAPS